MANSTQANFDAIQNADAHAQGTDGGLNLKTDPTRLAPPATTRSDNAWYPSPGNTSQLPAFTSTMQAATQHVYNLHARDLQQPSSSGDVMVHGEVQDAPGSTINCFTTPCWSHGNQQVVNTQVPMPPWTTRTRVMTAKLRQTGGIDQWNMLSARQESGYSASSPRRHVLAYCDGTNLYATFGLIDGQIETQQSLTVPMTAQYVEILGIQNSPNWAVAWLNGATLSFAIYDFYGNVVRAASAITTTAQSTTLNAAGSFGPFALFQHAGRTLLAYIYNSTGSTYGLAFCDVLTQVVFQAPMTSSGAAMQGFAVASPYPFTAPSDTFYCVVLFCNQVYILAQTRVNGPLTVVGGGLGLNVATNTGYLSSASPTGSVNYQATLSVCAFDGVGVGTAASLGVTVFRHYPEQIATSWVSTWYQSVSADRLSFQANASNALSAGALTSLGQNVFRTPSGAALAGKAFSYNIAGGGCSAAKNAFVVVRCGAFEPYQGLQAYYLPYDFNNPKDWTYGQPTYFVIDHQARIVTRAFQSQGPTGSNNDSAYSLANQGLKVNNGSSQNYGYAKQPIGLSYPLVNTEINDVNALSITQPVWVQTITTNVVQWTQGPKVIYSPPPADIVFQPGALILNVSAQVANCPAVQAGSYTVLSGPMTCVHDGRGVVEASYHFLTNNLAVTYQNDEAGNPAGTYYWQATVEWQDSLGRVHRSTPSAKVSAHFTTGHDGANVAVPLPVTAKSAVGGTLVVRLFRSGVNNTLLAMYQVATATVVGFDGSNQYAILFDPGYIYDPQSSSYSATNSGKLDQLPRLYTYTTDANGNIPFVATAPQPYLWQAGAKGRVFGLAQVMGQHRLYYSSAMQDNFPFEWNDSNYAPVPPEIGDVRSLETIDDKVVVFGTRTNAVMNGDGPPNGSSTGVANPGDGFSRIQPVPTPAGVLGTGSPVRTPEGIVFQGFSGVQLLGRDLSVQPIGAAVDMFTGRQVGNPGVVLGRSALLGSLQSVVWANPAGPALLYNYLTQRWSTWPLLSNAVNITQRLDGNVFVAIQPVANNVYAPLATATTPGADFGVLANSWAPLCQVNANAPGLVLETPWILPSGGSGGEAQVWDVTVTGTYAGPHILQVEQCYNYNATYQAQTQFQVASAPPLYQFRVRPKATTRIWSVRYRITLLPLLSLSVNYRMASVSDLVVNYGTKQGTSRIGAAASG